MKIKFKYAIRNHECASLKYLAMLIVVLILCSETSATISGSVTISPTEIQEYSTYSWVLNLASTIPDNGYIQINFPSDFDFSSEGTADVTKTCAPLNAFSGFTNSILSDSITCTLSPTTNILLARVNGSTNSNTLRFTIDNILNPPYAQQTSSIALLALDASQGTLEVSDSSFKVTPEPGSITATLTSADDVVGAKKKLTVDLTLSHNIPETGTIKMAFPKWNPEDSTPESVLSAGTVGCTAISGFVKTNLIVCTFSQGSGSTSLPDELTITGEFNSTATNIRFSISNFRNAPSLASFTTISVTTSTSSTSEIIDKATGVSIPLTQVATLIPNSDVIAITDTEVNKETSYSFKIKVGLPLPVGSSIQLTFPSTVSPSTTTPEVVGVSYLDTDVDESYDSGTRVLTLSNLNSVSNTYVDENFYINFTVNYVINHGNTLTSDSFKYASFDPSGNAIEAFDSGVTVTATAGAIDCDDIVPADYIIRTETTYTFSFSTSNDIPADGIIYIVFPSSISAADRTGTNCLSSGTTIDTSTAQCTVTSNRYLTITSGFSSIVSSGTDIVFTVSEITNAETIKTSDTFTIETQNSSGNTIDSLQESKTVTATVGTISSITVTPSSYYTGVQATYGFTISITTESILMGSYIDVTFPDSISIADTEYSESTCDTTIGLSGSLTCEFQSSQVLRLTNGFTTADFLSGTLVFTIAGIINPRSTQVTDSFQVEVYDANGYGQYAITSGITVEMTDPSEIDSITLTSGSQVNGATTDYTFSMTLENDLENGDIIKLAIPSQVTVSSSTIACAGSSNLASSLTCSLSGSNLSITVATGSSSTTIKADSLVIFVVKNIKNPSTLSTTDSFSIEINTSSGDEINVVSSDLTVTTTERGSISSISVVPSTKELSTKANYLVTFTPSNDIPQNSIIQIGIPEEISVASGTTTMTCVAVTLIESTLTCEWSSANRVISINKGFLTQSSYAASQISFYINNLANPADGGITESFTIETLIAAGTSVDYANSGVTYNFECTSPCHTCSGSLSTCTSCDSSADYGYLYGTTCVEQCPSGSYLDTDNTCTTCDESCLECTESSTKCTSCPLDPYKVLYGYSCRSSCPRFYKDVNQECKLRTEAILPLIILVSWVMFLLLLGFLKIMKSHTLLFSSLVAYQALILVVIWFAILSYLFNEGEKLAAVCFICVLAVSYIINAVWCVVFYRPYIAKKDAFYFQWINMYHKTDCLFHILSYAVSFIMFRVTLCRFLSLGSFSAALHRDRIISRVMNYFTVAYIGLVCLPIICLNIYCIFVIDASEMWLHIESWVLVTIQATLLIIEIISNNRINLFDSFLLKSTYNKIKYEIEKGKYDRAVNEATVLETMHNYMVSCSLINNLDESKPKTYQLNKRTKADILSHIVLRNDCREIKNLLVHYRHSELPSPTNEVNLVKSQPKKCMKDPRTTKSYPTSPRTQKEARIKWDCNEDDANVDWDKLDNSVIDHTHRNLMPVDDHQLGKISPSKHIKQPSEISLVSDEPKTYSDEDTEKEKSDNESEGEEEDLEGEEEENDSEEDESSELDIENHRIASNAVKNAINAQEESHQQSSDKSTMKLKRNDLSTHKVAISDHLKLTKLKREINLQRRQYEETLEKNKLKKKEKKELEQKIAKLKEDIEKINKGATMTEPGSHITEDINEGFVEQKGRPSPSPAKYSISRQSRFSSISGEGNEENKYTMEDLMRKTAQSKVTTDYWKKVRDRELGSATSWNRGQSIDGTEDQETIRRHQALLSYGSSHSQSRIMMTSAEDFFGPKRPFQIPFHQMMKSIDTVESGGNVTSIENAEFFGNVLPPSMTNYNPNGFRHREADGGLNSMLPDINQRRQGTYFQGVFVKDRNNYFQSSEADNISQAKSKRSRKSSIPRPKDKKSNEAKTARMKTASELPNIHTPRGGSNTRRNDQSYITYKRHDLDITNESDLERAYKNLLPREAEMLSDTIQIESARPSSGITRKPGGRYGKNMKNRLKSIGADSRHFTGAPSPKLSPMQRRKKNKKKVKSKSKTKGKKKSLAEISFYH